MAPNSTMEADPMEADQLPVVACEDIEAGDMPAPIAEQPEFDEEWLGLPERRPLGALLATGAISALLAAAALLLAANVGHAHGGRFPKKPGHIAAAAAMVGLEERKPAAEEKVLVRLIQPHGHIKEAHFSARPREMPLFDGDTSNRPDCFTKHKVYSPLDMVGSIPMQVNSAAECQEQCFTTKRCQHFSFDDIGKVCHMQDGMSLLWKVPGAFTSGPRVCNGSTTLQQASAGSAAPAKLAHEPTNHPEFPQFSSTAAEDSPVEMKDQTVANTLVTAEDTNKTASQMKLSNTALVASTSSSSSSSIGGSSGDSSTGAMLTTEPPTDTGLITLTASSKHTRTKAMTPKVEDAIAGLRASMALRARPEERRHSLKK
mmetsp:Transcript_132125/g.263667  ORF Transcript_132125/g.263667 Transcript_132125/m.263667 type:complete len:373 (+) Transcript_132125:32-1150(+)